jgi:drug/metabolite transporter (DMT)-like permease
MLWSFALFGSVPSLTEGVGGAIVLAGVLLVTSNRTARGR